MSAWKLDDLLSLRRDISTNSWYHPSAPALHPVFSFRTSGFQGGAHSWLEIAIDSNDAQMQPQRVFVRFEGDIELRGVLEGLEDLVRCLRFKLPADRDGHHA